MRCLNLGRNLENEKNMKERILLPDIARSICVLEIVAFWHIFDYSEPVGWKYDCDYAKRNFTTSHIHALLSMSLLKVISESSYCIFIESTESLNLAKLGKKKTFSPWLYEEIEYMKTLAPKEPKMKIQRHKNSK